MKTIVIVATLDTKGPETHYVKDLFERRGHRVIVIDGSGHGAPGFSAEYPAEEVARRAGTNLKEVKNIKGAGEPVRIMGEGARIIVNDLYRNGELDGIFGLGGGGNAALASAAMRDLPFGIPKFLVSTKINDPGSAELYAAAKDIILMPSIADIAGLNKVTRQTLAHAASALCGMLEAPEVNHGDKPIVVLSMTGLTTGLGLTVKTLLEEQGFEVVVFHAIGIGGKYLEDFVFTDPDVLGVIEGCLWEIGNELFDGISTSGPRRLVEAGKRGLPQVLIPGSCACIAFRGLDTVPEKYRDRHLHEHNPKATPMLLHPEETTVAGEVIAEKMNRTTGPIEVLIPRGGLSSLTGREGTAFYEAERDLGSEKVFIETLMKNLREDIPVKEFSFHINDPEFAKAAVESFLRITNEERK
ncbi:MAG: Tm-1-like ATP-binding domain-containing protein [Deltaproteobacteria bacterium]|nr:Tm-1-like ATP-binding domain-containing protein [Deltaproteobacteria bacterium]